MVSFSPARILLIGLALCAAAPACKPGRTQSDVQPEVTAAAATPAPASTLPQTCPVQVPATAVTVVNTKTGVAMYFTTTARNVDELRRRVATLAMTAVVAAATDEPETPRSSEVPYWEAGALPFMVPMHVLAEDVPDGARIVMTPVKPSDLDNLRSYALRHGDSMQLGRCSPDFLKGRNSGPIASEGSAPDKLNTVG